MNQPNCPSRDKLQGFVSGAIPEEQAEAVAEHLETCVECEATVEQIGQWMSGLWPGAEAPTQEDAHAAA